LGNSTLKSATLSGIDSASDMKFLVESASNGDESAVSSLVELTQDGLYRFFLYLTADSALSQDLSQDAYVRAFSKLHLLKEPEKSKSWLYRFGKNLFIDYVRANKKHKAEALDEERLSDADSAQQDLIISTRQVLDKLEQNERIILVLVDMEGRSYQEAAEVLDVSESALRSRLHRARKSFLAEYEKK